MTTVHFSFLTWYSLFLTRLHVFLTPPVMPVQDPTVLAELPHSVTIIWGGLCPPSLEERSCSESNERPPADDPMSRTTDHGALSRVR